MCHEKKDLSEIEKCNVCSTPYFCIYSVIFCFVRLKLGSTAINKFGFRIFLDEVEFYMYVNEIESTNFASS